MRYGETNCNKTQEKKNCNFIRAKIVWEALLEEYQFLLKEKESSV